MPASPFGLAYGLGVAANAIPTQMNERQNMDLQTQMRQLQLSQLQRQEAEQKAMQQAAMNVQPEMESKAALSPENMPQGLDMTPASPEAQASAKGLNLPIPGAIPNAPTDQQMAAVQRPLAMRQQAKVYSTPYQAAAHRYGAMADYLFKQGMVEPAMRLQSQAQQASKLHQETTLSQAARAASLGSYGEATRMLNGIGMNVSNMDQSPDDPEAVRIESQQNGQPIFADVPKRFLGAMIEDPAKASQSMAMLDWRMGSIQSREKIAASKIASTENQKELDRKSREKLAEIRASRPAGVLGSTADERKVAALVAANPGMTPSQAWDRIKPDIQARGAVTNKDRLRAVIDANKEIRKSLGGVPSEKDPEYTEFMQNEAERKRLMQGGSAPEQAPAAPVNAGNIPEGTDGTAKDGTPVVRRGGKWVAK